MARIMLTGANGLLGSAIANTCVGHVVNGDNSPDVYIHCAARVGGWKMNKEEPESILRDNLLVNYTAVRDARQAGVRHFIAFGCSCMFDPSLPATTSNLLAGEPYHNHIAYAYSKRMLLVHLEAAKRQHGMEYSFIVPPSLYGPHDNFHLENGHVIPSLIHKAHLAREAKQDLELWDDGQAEREFAYAPDVAKFVVDHIDNPLGRHLLPSGCVVPIKHIASQIAFYFQIDKKYGTQPAGELRRRGMYGDVSWATTAFEVGIKQTIEWFRANYPNVRR